MTPDITRLTLGELISDPDTVVQRHAHGIIKRLRARECPEHPPGACYVSCPFRVPRKKLIDSLSALAASPVRRP